MSNNKIELNPNMQYILAADISASMDIKDSRCGGQSRYDYMIEKFKSFVKESEDFDPDGPTIILFGENVKTFPNVTFDKIEGNLKGIRFEGFTNTHLAVEAAWEQHRQEKAELAKESKVHPGTVLFVFTDGQPTNQSALERTIVNIANSVDREDEFNIGFVLVGTIDAALQDYLTKLDDGLSTKAKYDIVGTSEIEGLTFLKAVNNAVNE